MPEKGLTEETSFAILTDIRGSQGFDRGLAAGEAIRCDTLNAN